MLWLALLRDNPSDIKEIIIDKIEAEELQKETGLQKFMEAINEAFKPSNEQRQQEVYNNYYVHMKRKTGEKMKDYLNRFNKAANFAKITRWTCQLKSKD